MSEQETELDEQKSSKKTHTVWNHKNVRAKWIKAEHLKNNNWSIVVEVGVEVDAMLTPEANTLR